ncbi:MAG TPA: radical SAM protein [Blastocatellia bacterium]|nr:radical SAM protein [Blastocatellia bacterium]
MIRTFFLRLKKKARSINRRYREARMIAAALKSPYRPILAQIIPIRRCNLSCAYCNEYDKTSEPVPTEEMLRRIDRLAALGAMAITFSGGEPLLHPELEVIVGRIRHHDIIATLITNGYLLTAERIERLNRAGLDYLQISVDNINPDDVSKKSLKVLDQKLRLLAERAEFDVTINSVLGSSIRQPEDALAIARRVRELGFKGTVGIIHDHSGQLQPLSESQQSIYDEILNSRRKSFFAFDYYNQFQKNLVRGLPNQWHCRAGSRYLYVCEDGLAHYCSQQRGYPAIPLADYTREHLERENKTVKSCAPYCTISCVHQVATVDALRENPREALAKFFPSQEEQNANLPRPIKILTWFFLPANPHSKRRVFQKAALRLLRVK